MTVRRGSPVDGAVVVAHDVVSDLLELGVVPHASDALDAPFGEVVVDGEKLVLAEFRVRRIDLHFLLRTHGEASLGKADPRPREKPDSSEGIIAATGGNEGVVES